MSVPQSSTDWIMWKYAGESSGIEKRKDSTPISSSSIFIIHQWASWAWNINSNTYNSFTKILSSQLSHLASS